MLANIQGRKQSSLIQPLQKIEGVEMLPTSFYKSSIIQIPKPDTSIEIENNRQIPSWT